MIKNPYGQSGINRAKDLNSRRNDLQMSKVRKFNFSSQYHNYKFDFSTQIYFCPHFNLWYEVEHLERRIILFKQMIHNLTAVFILYHTSNLFCFNWWIKYFFKKICHPRPPFPFIFVFSNKHNKYLWSECNRLSLVTWTTTQF